MKVTLSLSEMQTVLSTREADVVRLKEQDERNKDRAYGAVSRSYTVPSKPKRAAVIPEGTKVTRVMPGVARGVESQKMRARSDAPGGREPKALTIREKRTLLLKYAAGLSPAQLALAKAHLGLK